MCPPTQKRHAEPRPPLKCLWGVLAARRRQPEALCEERPQLPCTSSSRFQLGSVEGLGMKAWSRKKGWGKVVFELLFLQTYFNRQWIKLIFPQVKPGLPVMVIGKWFPCCSLDSWACPSYFLPVRLRQGVRAAGWVQPAAGQVNPPPHGLPGAGIKHCFQIQSLKSSKKHSSNPSCLLLGGTVNTLPSPSKQDWSTNSTVIKSDQALEALLRFSAFRPAIPNFTCNQRVMKLTAKAKHLLSARQWYLWVSKIDALDFSATILAHTCHVTVGKRPLVRNKWDDWSFQWSDSHLNYIWLVKKRLLVK